MECRICGDAVDDPFWDELCPECEHDLQHGHGDVVNHPGCSFCIGEAEDEFGYGDADDWDEAWEAAGQR